MSISKINYILTMDALKTFNMVNLLSIHQDDLVALNERLIEIIESEIDDSTQILDFKNLIFHVITKNNMSNIPDTLIMEYNKKLSKHFFPVNWHKQCPDIDLSRVKLVKTEDEEPVNKETYLPKKTTDVDTSEFDIIEEKTEPLQLEDLMV